jgi:hypothetical protein
MAFSSSIKKAQIVKLCDLCETETNLKWNFSERIFSMGSNL